MSTFAILRCVWRVAPVVLLLLVTPAHAEEPGPEAGQRIWPAFVIAGAGALLSGGYLAGAFATGDRPSAVPLAVTGGIVTGGLLGAGLALGINSLRKDPGSLIRYVLVPVLSGLAGAALGGLAAGFGSAQPGTGRTITHVVVVSFLVGETITLMIAR
ncbi:MAG: hypothetical protein U0228_36580 [Myxococcaceae bacterium]